MELRKEGQEPDANELQKRHETAEHIRDEKLSSHPREDGPETEKYLELEQPGVSYTEESNPTMNSDYMEADEAESDTFNPASHNSRNSDAFGQDDYILNDNIDLDEDQNQSISSDDLDR
jgi:hypothetical protein